MYSVVNTPLTYIYPSPTSCRGQAGQHRGIRPILALRDSGVKLDYNLCNGGTVYHVIGRKEGALNSLGRGREDFTKELTFVDFLSHMELGDVKVRTGWGVGSPRGLLLLLLLCFYLLHTLGFQMKLFSEKKALL